MAEVVASAARASSHKIESGAGSGLWTKLPGLACGKESVEQIGYQMGLNPGRTEGCCFNL